MMDKHTALAMQHQAERLEAAKKELHAWQTAHPDQEYNPKTNKIEWKVKEEQQCQ